MALILYYYSEFSSSVKEESIVYALLFSKETRTLIREEMENMPALTFNNLLSALRKKGVLTRDNKIINTVIPPLKDNGFLLVFNFEIDETDKK